MDVGNDSNGLDIREALLYSSIMAAMNAARIIKSIDSKKRRYNRTERELLAHAQSYAILEATKLWDKSGFCIERLLRAHRSEVGGTKHDALQDELAVIKSKHQEHINRLFSWRNKLMAHLGVKDNEQFNQYIGDDLADTQRMISDLAGFVQSLPWYPKHIPMQFLEYHQIERDLRL